jgi:hypothetical protein
MNLVSRLLGVLLIFLIVGLFGLVLTMFAYGAGMILNMLTGIPSTAGTALFLGTLMTFTVVVSKLTEMADEKAFYDDLEKRGIAMTNKAVQQKFSRKRSF